ncbi:hypothetical protein ACEF39_002147 [Stenotrophomonas indicatrix]
MKRLVSADRTGFTQREDTSESTAATGMDLLRAAAEPYRHAVLRPLLKTALGDCGHSPARLYRLHPL